MLRSQKIKQEVVKEKKESKEKKSQKEEKVVIVKFDDDITKSLKAVGRYYRWKSTSNLIMFFVSILFLLISVFSFKTLFDKMNIGSLLGTNTNINSNTKTFFGSLQQIEKAKTLVNKKY